MRSNELVWPGAPVRYTFGESATLRHSYDCMVSSDTKSVHIGSAYGLLRGDLLHGLVPKRHFRRNDCSAQPELAH